MRKYKIKYQHTSFRSATSMKEARRLVRNELGLSRLSAIANCSDGTYIWRDSKEMNNDDTGANARAVIESPEQQECHC